MTGERIEEYLEKIDSLGKSKGNPVKSKDIAEELGVSQASVSEMVQKLAVEGLVEHEPYHGVELTNRAVLQVNSIRRKHHVIEKFLSDVLALEPEVAHNEACGLEHTLSDLVVESMCNYLGNNNIDCKPADGNEHCPFKESYVSLADLKEGDCGTVVMMTLSDSSKGRLSSLGMITGENIEVKRKQKQGSTSILTRGTEIALGNEIAKKIFVRLGMRKRYPRGHDRN